MRRIPQRQFKMWMVRLEELWNEPDRSDYYLMTIRNEIRSIFGKAETNLDRFKIPFTTRRANVDPTIKTAEGVALSKAVWMAIGTVAGKRPGVK